MNFSHCPGLGNYHHIVLNLQGALFQSHIPHRPSESGIHVPLGYVPCTGARFSGPDTVLQNALLQLIVGEILVSAGQTMLRVPFSYDSLDIVLVHRCF